MKGDVAGGPIRWRLHIPAPPIRVFEALTTDAERGRFWAETTERSDRIHFRFRDGSTFEGRIRELRAPDLFACDYFGGIARFELASDGAGGTDLLLIHTGVAIDDWQETHAGWLNVLLPLKAWVAFGIDLRNHDPTRTWEAGYADQ